MNRIFYYNGKQAVIDILNFQIVKSKKMKISELVDHYKKINPLQNANRCRALMTKLIYRGETTG